MMKREVVIAKARKYGKQMVVSFMALLIIFGTMNVMFTIGYHSGYDQGYSQGIHSQDYYDLWIVFKNYNGQERPLVSSDKLWVNETGGVLGGGLIWYGGQIIYSAYSTGYMQNRLFGELLGYRFLLWYNMTHDDFIDATMNSINATEASGFFHVGQSQPIHIDGGSWNLDIVIESRKT